MSECLALQQLCFVRSSNFSIIYKMYLVIWNFFLCSGTLNRMGKFQRWGLKLFHQRNSGDLWFRWGADCAPTQKFNLTHRICFYKEWFAWSRVDTFLLCIAADFKSYLAAAAIICPCVDVLSCWKYYKLSWSLPFMQEMHMDDRSTRCLLDSNATLHCSWYAGKKYSSWNRL